MATPGAPPVTQSSAASLLASLLKIAGAVAGLTGILYVVGAITIWVRLRLAGFSPDVGLEHRSRWELVATGFRGVIAVTAACGAVLVSALIILVLLRLFSARLSENAQTKLTAGVQRMVGERANPLRRPVPQGVVLLAVIAGSSFASWRVFGLVFLLSVGALVVIYCVHAADSLAALTSAVSLGSIILAACIAGISWQLAAPVKIQPVLITPLPGFLAKRSGNPALAEKTAFPYFGETDKYIYVAELTNVRRKKNGGCCRWKFTRRIVEVKRAEVLLRFPAESAELYPEVKSPADMLWRRLKANL